MMDFKSLIESALNSMLSESLHFDPELTSIHQNQGNIELTL